jgi:hypothetical protein
MIFIQRNSHKLRPAAAGRKQRNPDPYQAAAADHSFMHGSGGACASCGAKGCSRACQYANPDEISASLRCDTMSLIWI